MPGDITVGSDTAGAPVADSGGAAAPNGSGIEATSPIVEVEPEPHNGSKPGTTAVPSSGGASGGTHAGSPRRVSQASSDSTSGPTAIAPPPPEEPLLDSPDSPVEEPGA
jgi:hypothetical protein